MRSLKTSWLVIAAAAATFALCAAATLDAAEPATRADARRSSVHHRFADSPLGQFLAQRAIRVHELQAQLALSDEQKTAFRETLKAHKNEIVAALKPISEAKRTLRNAVLADNTDDAAIRAAADTLGKSIGDAAVVMARIKADIKAQVMLTPEQETSLKSFRIQRDDDIDTLFSQPR